MSVIRIEKKKRMAEVRIDSTSVRDNSLKFQELGLLVYLLDKSDDYAMRPDVLARERGVSRASIYNYLRGLIQAGYVERIMHKQQVSKGRWKTISIYQVFETKEMCQEYKDLVKFGKPDMENIVQFDR